MDILTDYRIATAHPREHELAEVAERVRVAYERLRVAQATTKTSGPADVSARRGWFARLTDRTSTRSETATPCAPVTR